MIGHSDSGMKSETTAPAAMAWMIWALGAMLYLIGFFQRVAPAVMTAELMREFHIGAAALGNLSAFYFYSYVLMQIPTGVLADNWGARRLLTAGALGASAGSLIFGVASGLMWANLGRLLIGGSVAVAWVGMLKLANHWFPPNRFSFVAGVALFSGIIGAVSAGVPLRLFIDLYGWRPVMLFSAAVTLLLSAATWWIVRDDPQDKGYRRFTIPARSPHRLGAAKILADILAVLRCGNVWLLFLAPGGIVGCILTFSGLWGVPFLTTHYRMATTQAAAIASTLLVAWAVGGPIFGAISDRICRRKLPYLIGCGATAAGWMGLLFIPGLPFPLLLALVLITGFASGCMIIGFAYAKESVPAELAGTVSGLINAGVMLGPTLLQPAVGWVLDRQWQGQIMDGVRVYSLEAYRAGFLLMAAWAVLALVLLLFTRETSCKQAPAGSSGDR